MVQERLSHLIQITEMVPVKHYYQVGGQAAGGLNARGLNGLGASIEARPNFYCQKLVSPDR